MAQTTELLAYFRDKHEQILGAPYMVTWGRDNKILQEIGTTYGVEKTQHMIDAFFGMVLTDEFLQKTGATVGLFKSQIPKAIMVTRHVDKRKAAGKWL